MRQRARPIAGQRARFENSLAGPGQRRILPRRFLGNRPRVLVVVAAARLDEQAMQTKRFGIGAVRHVAEHTGGGFPVAGKLRRLRAEQQRERFGGRDALGFSDMLARSLNVAGADRDQAL